MNAPNFSIFLTVPLISCPSAIVAQTSASLASLASFTIALSDAITFLLSLFTSSNLTTMLFPTYDFKSAFFSASCDAGMNNLIPFLLASKPAPTSFTTLAVTAFLLLSRFCHHHSPF